MTETRYIPMGVYYPLGALERLRTLVDGLVYKPGWTFDFHATGGELRVLFIRVDTINSFTGEPILIDHTLPIPPIDYSVSDWKRWLLDQILLVEQHEACEFFSIDGVKIFHPVHGPDGDPYIIREVSDASDRFIELDQQMIDDGGA